MNILTAIYVVMFFFGILFVTIFLELHLRNKKRINDYPKPTKYPTISFLVPAYNEEDSIRNTVEALMNTTYPNEKKEIIIINDGSKDKTEEIGKSLEKKYKGIVKLLSKKNSGKADSLNQAIKIASGELIAVTDADSYPKPDALEKMVGYFEEENVSAVTSRVLVKNKKNWLGRYQVLDYSIIAWTRKLLDFVDSVYVTNGPLSIYRKSVVEKIGGFDPANMTEDIEITWHILSEGYKTKMSYSAIVYTTVPEDLKTWIKQRVRWNLGGIQTLYKYRKFVFRKPGNLFGYFVIPYVGLSFVLAIVGFLLLTRFIWIKGSFYFYSVYYAFRGYDLLNQLGFDIYLTLLIFLGLIFFAMAIWHYKLGFKTSETGNQKILRILSYTMIYRPLYIIPLIQAIYKLARRDIRWYTK
ncbi:glycosyltransferase family 2 protein [Candidatus Pacearchaeota archaeon]|nr:glycosyltransferase family 2 protein [Candidatus Pacearchaeota archaeon]